MGWTPIVVARDVSTFADQYRAENILVVQAPMHKSQVPPGQVFRARSFADIIAACGFQRLEALWPVVIAWDSLLDLIRPAAVVADYCPILPLACLGRIAVVTIGDGFVVPPGHLPTMPQLQKTGTQMAPEEVSCPCLRSAAARSSLPISLQDWSREMPPSSVHFQNSTFMGVIGNPRHRAACLSSKHVLSPSLRCSRILRLISPKPESCFRPFRIVAFPLRRTFAMLRTISSMR